MDTQLYRGINVKAFLVRTLKDIWQTQFFYRCAIKSKPLAKWCTIIPLPAIFRLENAGYLRLFHPFLNDILHPYIKSYTLSYTLSYTRKCQSVKYFSMPGVGNVGYFRLYRYCPWIAHTKTVSQISSCNGRLFKIIV